MKVLKIILATASMLFFVAIIVVNITVGPFINTFVSLEKEKDDRLYELNFTADYFLPDILSQGCASSDDVSEIVFSKYKDLTGIDLNSPAYACSTFYASDGENGNVTGRNFDWDEPCLPIVMHTSPKDGYESVSTVNGMFIGFNNVNELDQSFLSRFTLLAAPYAPLDGINEKGVTVSTLCDDVERYDNDTNKADITLSIAVRMILDYADSVDSAVKMVEKYDVFPEMDNAFHLFVSDAQNRAAIIEFVDGEMQVTKSTDEENLVCTNFNVYKYLKDNVRSNNAGKDACERYDRLKEYLGDKNGVLSSTDAADALSEVAGGFTKWSNVYNNQDKSVQMYLNARFGSAYEFTATQNIGNAYYYYVSYGAAAVLLVVFVLLVVSVKKHKKHSRENKPETEENI